MTNPGTALQAANDQDLTIRLANGLAENMGEGLFIVFQADDQGNAQTVVLTRQDLEDMLSSI